MTLKEIVIDWLREHGYDGLYQADCECGCDVKDLMPCGGVDETCAAGYKKKADPVQNEFRHSSSYDFVIEPGVDPLEQKCDLCGGDGFTGCQC